MNLFEEILLKTLARITFKNAAALELSTIICIVVGIMLFSYVIWYSHKWFKITHWPFVQGNIIDYQEKIDIKGSEFPKVKITYVYKVNGISYRNDKLTFGLHLDRPKLGLLSFVRKNYSVGQMINVFFDPVRPWKSILIKDFDVSAIVAALSLSALCVFLASSSIFF